MKNRKYQKSVFCLGLGSILLLASSVFAVSTQLVVHNYKELEADLSNATFFKYPGTDLELSIVDKISPPPNSKTLNIVVNGSKEPDFQRLHSLTIDFPWEGTIELNNVELTFKYICPKTPSKDVPITIRQLSFSNYSENPISIQSCQNETFNINNCFFANGEIQSSGDVPWNNAYAIWSNEISSCTLGINTCSFSNINNNGRTDLQTGAIGIENLDSSHSNSITVTNSTFDSCGSNKSPGADFYVDSSSLTPKITIESKSKTNLAPPITTFKGTQLPGRLAIQLNFNGNSTADVLNLSGIHIYHCGFSNYYTNAANASGAISLFTMRFAPIKTYPTITACPFKNDLYGEKSQCSAFGWEYLITSIDKTAISYITSMIKNQDSVDSTDLYPYMFCGQPPSL